MNHGRIQLFGLRSPWLRRVIAGICIILSTVNLRGTCRGRTRRTGHTSQPSRAVPSGDNARSGLDVPASGPIDSIAAARQRCRLWKRAC